MEADWRGELETWLTPFVAGLRNKTRGRMCPAYIAGLIGPGDRKSVQPMAARDVDVSYDRLHHFIGSGIWDEVPLEMALLAEADRQVGGEDSWLIIDDTALPKKGRHSVGVAPQYASALGKNANCQTLVSLTLASREVPVMVGLRLFLPESWTSDVSRLERAGVPEDLRSYMTKPEIALAEIDKVRAAGVRFGCVLILIVARQCPGIVDAVSITDQGVEQRTHFEKLMPVTAGSRQARHFDPQHQPDMAEAHLRNEALEARPVQRRGSGTAKIIIDDGHLLALPTKMTGPIRQTVLQPGGLPVLRHLPHRRLANIDDRLPLLMSLPDLFRQRRDQFHLHGLSPGPLTSAAGSTLPE